jgi:hypothetical protein
MCAALATTNPNSPSLRIFHTGVQYTPVASIATCVTRLAVSQSSKANRPSVVVVKVRHSRVDLRPTISRTQATTSPPLSRGQALVDIETGDPFVHNFHVLSSTPVPPVWEPPTKRNLTSALRALPPLAPVGVFEAPRVQLATGLSAPRSVDLCPTTSHHLPPRRLAGFIQGGSAAGR